MVWHAGMLGWLVDGAEDRERSRDLGPAPIGSDPWLRAEIGAALARDPALRAASFVVEVANAAVTIRGVAPDLAARVERAVRTVQGIAALHLEAAR